jgi:hypothetical protein
LSPQSACGDDLVSGCKFSGLYETCKIIRSQFFSMEHEQKALLQNTRISGRLQKCKKTVLKYFIRQLYDWLSAV